MPNVLVSALVGSRFLDAYQLFTGRRCTVLMYHSIADGPDNPYFGGGEFARHVEMLRSEFRVLGADEYLWHLDHQKRFARRSILITFDDGFLNNYEVVRPIMERLQLPWVLFAPTWLLDRPDSPLWFVALRAMCVYTRADRIAVFGREWALGDKPARQRTFREIGRVAAVQPAAEVVPAVEALMPEHWPHVPPDYARSFTRLMSADQLRELAASPLIEIGGHTFSHPYLSRVSDGDLGRELDEPTSRLSELLGRRLRMFAYPSGEYTEREVHRVAKLGYDCAFTIQQDAVRHPRYEIARIGVYDPALPVVRAKALGVASLMRSVGITRT